VLITRSGDASEVASDAGVAATAQIIGNVRIGARAYVDHGGVIESSGPPIEIGAEAVLFAGAVVRSVGGSSRPAFPVAVGERTPVSPGCVVTGCHVGRNCYIATGATLLQGAPGSVIMFGSAPARSSTRPPPCRIIRGLACGTSPCGPRTGSSARRTSRRRVTRSPSSTSSRPPSGWGQLSRRPCTSG
jgi:carbonic anhydrase/acetyltransferase-like protein (isoleucine patch superfamily)